MNNTPTIIAVFLWVFILDAPLYSFEELLIEVDFSIDCKRSLTVIVFLLFFTVSETSEILCLQYSNQVVLVSSPKRTIWGVIAGLKPRGVCPRTAKKADRYPLARQVLLFRYVPMPVSGIGAIRWRARSPRLVPWQLSPSGCGHPVCRRCCGCGP